MEHGATQLVQVRSGENATVGDVAHFSFDIALRFSRLALTLSLLPIVREVQVLLAPRAVIASSQQTRADVRYSHHEAERCQQQAFVESPLTLFHKPAGRAVDDRREPVLVRLAGQTGGRPWLPTGQLLDALTFHSNSPVVASIFAPDRGSMNSSTISPSGSGSVTNKGTGASMRGPMDSPLLAMIRSRFCLR